MDVTSQTIPAWLISIIMLYTGLAWLLTRERIIYMDTRIFAHTLILWAVVYGAFQFLSIDIEVRGFLTRIMIIVLCLSQSVPLTISYLRSFKKS